MDILSFVFAWIDVWNKTLSKPLVKLCYPMTQTECARVSVGAAYSRQYAGALLGKDQV